VQDGSISRSYEGQFKNGYFHGKGHAAGSDGYQFDGEFIGGRQEGRGIEVTADGARYEGDFKQGKREGQGILTGKRNAETFRFEGSFKNGAPDGAGFLVIGEMRIDGTFRGGYIVRAVVAVQGVEKYEIDNEQAKVYRIAPDGKRIDENSSDLRDLHV
jgi:hypothetical protein